MVASAEYIEFDPETGAWPGMDVVLDRLHGMSAADVQKKVARGGYANLGPPGSGGVLSSISRAGASAASSVAHAATSAAHAGQSVLHAVTSNPAWDLARTGASFIPGVGSAVSAGMATAAAVGRGESLKNVAMQAAKGAIPGGPAGAAAFDIVTGAIRNGSLNPSQLEDAIVNHLPGGAIGQAAGRAALAVAHGQHVSDAVVSQLRNQVPANARGVFDTIVQRAREATHKATVPAFPDLGPRTQMVAQALHVTPALRQLKVPDLAHATGTRDFEARRAIAAFVQKLHDTPELDPRDVGELDTAETLAHRVLLRMPARPAPTSSVALATVPVPPMRLRVSRKFLHQLYTSGPTLARKALIAHGHLARVAANAGELQGTVWVVQSGESLSVIAKKMTGDANRWRELLPVNPQIKDPNKINVGQRITMPQSWLPVTPTGTTTTTPAATTSSTTTTSSSVGGTYTVQSGDSLSSIAKKLVGDSNRWRELLPVNPQITDPNKIYPGQKLTLPASWATGSTTTPATMPVGDQPVITKPTGTSTSSSTTTATATASPAQISILQIQLAAFVHNHAAEIAPDPAARTFGNDPSDYSGVYTARTQATVSAFQDWHRRTQAGSTLTPTGIADEATVAALTAVNQADAAKGLPGGGTVPGAGTASSSTIDAATAAAQAAAAAATQAAAAAAQTATGGGSQSTSSGKPASSSSSSGGGSIVPLLGVAAALLLN